MKRRKEEIVGPPRVIRVSPAHLTNRDTGELIGNLFITEPKTNESEESEETTSDLPPNVDER